MGSMFLVLPAIWLGKDVVGWSKIGDIAAGFTTDSLDSKLAVLKVI